MRSLDAKNRLDAGASRSDVLRGLLADTSNPDAVLGSDAANFASGLLGPMGAVGMGGVMTYHGTPHKFSKYDLSKIGTGEGAQVYGHGIYFAEQPDVAKVYQKTLGGQEVRTAGGNVPVPKSSLHEYGPQDEAARWMAVMADHPNPAQAAIDSGMAPKEIKPILSKWAAEKATVSAKGALYKQDLPDEVLPSLLHWDKPLSEQSEPVKAALKSVLPQPRPYDVIRKNYESVQKQMEGLPTISAKFNKLWDKQAALSREMDHSKELENITGAGILDRIGGGVSGQGHAAQRLLDAGIPGVSYFDAGSRGAGKGTLNHVIWDQGLLDRMIPQAIE